MYDVSAWKHFDLVMSALKELVILSETEEGIIAFEESGTSSWSQSSKKWKSFLV